jgi:hypothetical protein
MCPFYRTAKVSAVERRRAARDGETVPPPMEVSWCAHLYSPVTKYTATVIAGGWQKLLCAGDLTKCQVIPSQRPKL